MEYEISDWPIADPEVRENADRALDIPEQEGD